MKIKIFCETYPVDAETEINKWLEANPDITISHAIQSQVYHPDKDGMPVTISVFYEDKAEKAAHPGFAPGFSASI